MVHFFRAERPRPAAVVVHQRHPPGNGDIKNSPRGLASRRNRRQGHEKRDFHKPLFCVDMKSTTIKTRCNDLFYTYIMFLVQSYFNLHFIGFHILF